MVKTQNNQNGRMNVLLIIPENANTMSEPIMVVQKRTKVASSKPLKTADARAAMAAGSNSNVDGKGLGMPRVCPLQVIVSFLL